MILRHLRARALSLACALVLALPACAAADPNQLPAIPGPGGTKVLAQPMAIIGYDSGTGAPCVVGATATCNLPGTGGGGGGAITSVDLGVQADAVCAADTSTCSLIALAKRMNTLLTSLLTATDPIPAAQSGAWAMSLNAGDNGVGRFKLWDGTNLATIKAASTPPALTDTILVTAPSPIIAPQCTQVAPLNQTTSTKVIAGAAGKKTYICTVVVVTATAQGLSFAEGTGTACGTGTAYVMGGAGGTAQFAVNGGISAPSDRVTIPLQTVADDFCVIQSGAGNVSGWLTYAQQ